MSEWFIGFKKYLNWKMMEVELQEVPVKTDTIKSEEENLYNKLQ